MSVTDDIVCILMTSRSGSSMVADIYVSHGFHWARNARQNPLVGGAVRYHSFENQVVKGFNKAEFGTMLGDYITYDDDQLERFDRLVDGEYGQQGPGVWKGAVEYFPMWKGISDVYGWTIKPIIVWRPMQAVKDSLRAKRQGRVDEAALERITQKRYDLLSTLAVDHAFPVVETDALVRGDLSSIRQAFEYWEHDYDENVVRQVINPSKWEKDR